MRLALVGATGMVGEVMRAVLSERNLPISEFIPVASSKSAGQTLIWNGQSYTVVTPEKALAMHPDVAIFSAGAEISFEWAPRFAATGCYVIDNSSAWRMDPAVPLVVPEVNPETLELPSRIIANPNCSTIQLVMVLKPLHDKHPIRRVLVTTYQSVTGTGKAAVNQLDNERNGVEGAMVYPYPIDKNCLPHCDVFLDNAYTKEEMKLTHETKKILNDTSVRVSATAVRVPVQGGHSEAVNIEFVGERPSMSEVRALLGAFPGVIVQDIPETKTYPMPRFAEGKDDVFVGRIREDHSHPQAMHCWIVADNLRKGAATNAVQITEELIRRRKLQA
ncbi:MAG TPA: aspartate-semialdehyde dehydrogenase [Cryomorphaceae bacterium]|jgi:aspartate-semialdehyde dehydrogenase|nr:aspartate-semialdehyde dehydrogenase [Cryomorphaceae bacterium]HAB32470.1 aspartate-semialdehyde dehydrogenase [Cryomorphaceae bacterium]